MESGRELITRIADSLADVLSESDESVRLFEARVIAEHVTGDTYSELLANAYSLTSRQSEQIADIVHERSKEKPLAYILRSITFRDLDLYVDERVLIPRSETELVVQHAIDILRANNAEQHVIDIGTGSGAIALSIAHEAPQANVYATDISSDALDVARLNGVATGSPARRVQYFCGDLFESLPENIKGDVDLIISNPPYIGEDEKSDLDISVIDYEPHLALFADENGGKIYNRIIAEAQSWLKKDGHLVLEIAPRHVDLIKKLADENHYSQVSIYNDLAGRERVAILAD